MIAEKYNHLNSKMMQLSTRQDPRHRALVWSELCKSSRVTTRPDLPWTGRDGVGCMGGAVAG